MPRKSKDSKPKRYTMTIILTKKEYDMYTEVNRVDGWNDETMIPGGLAARLVHKAVSTVLADLYAAVAYDGAVSAGGVDAGLTRYETLLKPYPEV